MHAHATVVLEATRQYLETGGVSPTVDELAARVGLPVGAVDDLLECLLAEGWLVADGHAHAHRYGPSRRLLAALLGRQLWFQCQMKGSDDLAEEVVWAMGQPLGMRGV